MNNISVNDQHTMIMQRKDAEMRSKTTSAVGTVLTTLASVLASALATPAAGAGVAGVGAGITAGLKSSGGLYQGLASMTSALSKKSASSVAQGILNKSISSIGKF